jgi:predicted phosphodiesterase
MKKILLKVFYIILFSCINFNLYSFKFLVNSDMHVGATDQDTVSQYNTKKAQLVKMIEYTGENNVSFVLLAGDLTDTSAQANFNSFQNDWIYPLTQTKTGIYLCHGNHDGDDGCTKSPVVKYIKQTYGDVRYSFDFGGVHFVCCGMYPDYKKSNPCCFYNNCLDTITWLENDLEKMAQAQQNKSIQEMPIILFFHFNLTGDWSDWWSDENKNKLYGVLQGYNVLNIFTGHCHSTYTDVWNGIKTTCVGGDKFAICDCTNGTLEVDLASA